MARTGTNNNLTDEGFRHVRRRDKSLHTKLDSLRKGVEEGIRASEEGRVRKGREVMAEIRERIISRQR